MALIKPDKLASFCEQQGTVVNTYTQDEITKLYQKARKEGYRAAEGKAKGIGNPAPKGKHSPCPIRAKTNHTEVNAGRNELKQISKGQKQMIKRNL